MTIEIPPPFPDELLYSTIARAARRIGISHVLLSRVLHDQEHTVATLFPERLTVVANRLREFAGWTQSPDEIMANHTLAPLSLPFLPKAAQYKSAIMNAGGGPKVALFRVLGIPGDQKLRNCSVCSRDDVKLFGESYWHRLHQIPALKICALHGCPLTCTNVSHRRAYQYVALDEAVALGQLPVHENSLALQRAMASSLGDALNNPPKDFSKQAFAEVFRTFMKAHGARLGSPATLIRDLLSYYGAQMLSDLDIQIPGGSCRPISMFFGEDSHNSPPMHLYALLADRCGMPFTDLLEITNDANGPDRGPWPCKNPNCLHCEKPNIRRRISCERTFESLFTCPECKHTYKRPEPLTHERDGTFAFSAVTAKDTEWEERLRSAWMDDSLTMKTLVIRLARKWDTIRTHAARLALPDRPNRWVSRRHPLQRHIKGLAVRDRRRAEWIALRASRPLSESEFVRAEKLKAWFRSNDRVWCQTQPDLRVLDRRLSTGSKFARFSRPTGAIGSESSGPLDNDRTRSPIRTCPPNAIRLEPS